MEVLYSFSLSQGQGAKVSFTLTLRLSQRNMELCRRFSIAFAISKQKIKLVKLDNEKTLFYIFLQDAVTCRYTYFCDGYMQIKCIAMYKSYSFPKM